MADSTLTVAKDKYGTILIKVLSLTGAPQWSFPFETGDSDRMYQCLKQGLTYTFRAAYRVLTVKPSTVNAEAVDLLFHSTREGSHVYTLRPEEATLLAAHLEALMPKRH